MGFLAAALLIADALVFTPDGVLIQDPRTPPGGPRAALSWTTGSANPVGLGMSYSAPLQKFLPSVTVRLPLLVQGAAPFDLTLGTRFRPVGGEDTGAEVDAQVLVGRQFGTFALLANVAVGKGVGLRADVDFEATAFAGWTLREALRCGFEGRLQRELVDDFHTSDDTGRSSDVTAGVSLTLLRTALSPRAFLGWRSPRGTESAGPALAFGAGADF